MNAENKPFGPMWCIVEVMGHAKFAGRTSEQLIAGDSFVRVDIPAVGASQPMTKIFGTSSIYCITPVTEETAREFCTRHGDEPVQEWDARRMLRKLQEAEQAKLFSAGPPVVDGTVGEADDTEEFDSEEIPY